MAVRIPTSLAGRRLAVVGAAGNGGQPSEIVGIGVLNVNDLVVDPPLRTWLVRPVVPVSSAATKVHGIGNENLRRCPLWHGVAHEVERVLAGRVLVAHDAAAVHRTLAAHLPGWWPPLVLDVMALAEQVWPQLPDYGLDALATRAVPAAVEIGGRRAGGVGRDVWHTWSLLLALVEDGQLTWNDLIELASQKAFQSAAADQELVQRRSWARATSFVGFDVERRSPWWTS